MTLHHILFDADGVLQCATQHWQPALQSVLGLDDESHAQAVVADIFAAETKVLECEGGFVERLEAVLVKWGRAGLLAETLKVLHAIDVHDDVMQTVQAVRRAGIGCHIASNQQTLRARHMSEGLNYRALFDSEFYSCFVGAAKPRPAFFHMVLARLGCDPREVLFLDGRPENVEAARQAGLNAVVFLGADGALSLRRQLGNFGVVLDR